MLDIAEHRQKLILKNLAQLDDRTMRYKKSASSCI